jgi:hypothetical protein
MDFKTNVKENFNKMKRSARKNWKKILLISGVVLGVGVIGVAIGSKFGDDNDHREYRMESRMDNDYKDSSNWSDSKKSSNYSMTYDEWKTAISNSSLSTADKTTFTTALDKANDNIQKTSDLQAQIDKLYTDNLESLDTEYTTLVSKNAALWVKVDDDLSKDSLSHLDTDDITDLRQDVNSSTTLTDSEKTTLLADLDSLTDLKAKWSTAYATYVEKSTDLKTQLTTAENAVQTTLKDNTVTTSMISEVLGYNYNHDNNHDDYNHDNYDYDED